VGKNAGVPTGSRRDPDPLPGDILSAYPPKISLEAAVAATRGSANRKLETNRVRTTACVNLPALVIVPLMLAVLGNTIAGHLIGRDGEPVSSSSTQKSV